MRQEVQAYVQGKVTFLLKKCRDYWCKRVYNQEKRGVKETWIKVPLFVIERFLKNTS